MNTSTNFSVNKKNNYLLKILLATGGAAVVFLILNLFQAPIKNSFYFLSFPVERIFFSAGESSSGFFGSFFSLGSLAKKNENLKTENQRLLSQVLDLQNVESGNEALSDMAFTARLGGYDTTMAGVIGLDGPDMLSLNKGSADGIAENMPVVNQQGVLFGKVVKVYKNFSQVMLISSKDSVLDVKVLQTGEAAAQIYGALKGQGGQVYLDLVPVDQVIKENDVLATSSLEGTFPKNLLAGRIKTIDKNDQKPFQQAEVEPFFQLKGADNLFVITNFKEKAN